MSIFYHVKLLWIIILCYSFLDFSFNLDVCGIRSGILGIVGLLGWLDQLIGLLLSEALDNFWVGVGDHLVLLSASGLSERFGMGIIERWGVMSLTRAPVGEVLIILDFLGLGGSG